MRSALLLVHRWLGLFMAGFLIVTGLTGAVISWDHELDEWLNPHLTNVPVSDAPKRSPHAMVDEVEARHPRVLVSYFPVVVEPGHSIDYWVEPRVDPKTGELYDVPYNQVFVDPHTGAELGTRKWGAVWPLGRETFVSFLYKLHYSLHVPRLFGTDRIGIWLLGFVAILWTVDCFVGLYLTLPAANKLGEAMKSFWARWKPSWLVRTDRGKYKLNFDVHRASGLWGWGLFLVLAFTAISLNLEYEIVRPAVAQFAPTTPTVWEKRPYASDEEGFHRALTFERVLERAKQEAVKKGWKLPPGYVYYSRNADIFGVAFFRPGEEHGDGGVGPRQLYLDGQSGKLVDSFVPWTGTAADIFLQAQFPLHSGRLFGTFGRILVSLLGLFVATLSVTGVIIWWRKRIALVAAHKRSEQRASRLLQEPRSRRIVKAFRRDLPTP